MERKPSNSRRKRQEQPYYRYTAMVFGLLLLAFSLANLLKPDQAMSLKEKRMLNTFPGVQMGRVLEGGYSTDFEAYASDQILFRDFLTDLKVFGDTLLGKKESQGVFRATDDRLIEKMETPVAEVYELSLRRIRDYALLSEIPAVFVLVPNAAAVYADKLPLWAPSYDQSLFRAEVAKKLAGTLTLVDLWEDIHQAAESGELLYYRSDHHWTGYAAHQSAPTVLKALGKEFQDGWQPLPVCDNFIGSLAAKSGYTVSQPDTITLYVPETEPHYLITDSNGKRASLYSWEGLNSPDPYTVFLGGNEGFLHIETDQIGAGRLLVFKDSYFNSFLPYLLDAYESIDVVDPRYYSDSLTTLLYQNQYDQILYFYNINTFAQDTSLSLVLGEALEGR